ncbi:hypothetical protein CLV30_106115 [Haloactinopolyspora alba]|uniref:Uncharacterized protein n=1 Tax=Haloactinopolyspora alba TaxID=648780 RepID=A0A2P8E3R5_9ACTN|nr:hypothetical protein [Haloactinopolyspora alba]PSL04112.1 hypothetical protein CLV30_106115 [Haloactinopolyspora alba]
MIREGREWQVRALADAADAEQREDYRPVGRAYLRGMSDALRVLVGDLDPREASAALTLAYERYLDSI